MKKYKFLFFILLLAFLFIPKDVFASDTNIITPGSQELFWDGTNAQGGYESNRFNSTQNHLYQWGTSSATYTLYRFAPLVNFTSLGVDTSYKARVAFYVFTSYPYSYDDNYCTLWSANNEKFSCSLYRKTEDQIGSNEVLLTLVYDYEWTSSTGYVEFWSNFTNFKGVPDKTQFMYTILDFHGNVSGNQIILDGLGQTNEKLDEINDTLKDTFEKCSKSPNLFTDWEQGGIDGTDGFLGNWDARYRTTDYISVNSSDEYYFNINDNYKYVGLFFYDSSKNYLGYYRPISNYFNYKFNSNTKYLKVVIGNTSDTTITSSDVITASPKLFKGKDGLVCKNRIDETNEKLDELNDKIGDLENSITSEDGPNLDGLDNSAGWLPAGPVDSILNLPFSFFENLTDNLSKTCQPVAMTFPFTNTNFQLPCISTLYEKIGILDFLNWLGVVVGAIILYRYFLSLYKWVDDTLTFRENNHNDWGGV